MRAIVGIALALVLLLPLDGAAQTARRFREVFIIFENDPMGLAQDLNQYFSSRGIQPKLFRASTFNNRRSATSAPSQVEGRSSGTGFFVDDSGTLVTNYHVVDGRQNVAATLANGTKLPAVVLSASPALDVAVLRVQGYRPERFIALVGTGDRNVGEQIFAVGYPLTDVLGSAAKVTDGVISSFSGLGGDASLMQISAPVQPGNSGGPILLQSGESVGIAVARLSDSFSVRRYGTVPQNVNFAIRTDFVRPVVDAFIQVNDSSRRASSVQQAVQATIYLEASNGPLAVHASPASQAHSTSNTETADVIVQFKYSTFFDGFADQLGDLQVSVENADTGEIVSNFAWSGATSFGKRNIVARAIKQLDADLGLVAPSSR